MKIAIISGKGGTGKSCITADFIAQSQSCFAIDCDVDAANLYLLFDQKVEKEEKFISGSHPVIDETLCRGCGKCVSKCHYNALSMVDGKVVVDEIACEGCELCSRVCPMGAITMSHDHESSMYFGTFRFGYMARARLYPGEENSGRLISELRKEAATLNDRMSYDHVIMDGPPGIGCPVISTITGVDMIVMVTEPTRSGIADLKRVNALADSFGIKRAVIINKADLDEACTQQIEKWCDENKIVVAAKVPFDKQMVEAMLAKKSISEYAPQSVCAKTLKDAWQQVLTEGKRELTEEEKQERENFLKNKEMENNEVKVPETTATRPVAGQSLGQGQGLGRGQGGQGLGLGLGNGFAQGPRDGSGRGQNFGAGQGLNQGQGLGKVGVRGQGLGLGNGSGRMSFRRFSGLGKGIGRAVCRCFGLRQGLKAGGRGQGLGQGQGQGLGRAGGRGQGSGRGRNR